MCCPAGLGKEADLVLRRLAGWFVEQGALRVCVNVDPTNVSALGFYARHHAEAMSDQWRVWKDISAVAGCAYWLGRFRGEALCVVATSSAVARIVRSAAPSRTRVLPRSPQAPAARVNVSG